MTIAEIEKLTINDVKNLVVKGKAEEIKIKEHDCYLTNLGDAFGYSVLVFKNGKHIYYSNDYQLHHGKKTVEELKEWYIYTLNRKLFTESELMEDVIDYDEYRRKEYYVRNYWIMQFDRVSAFYIGKPDKDQEEAKRNMFYCPTCFCYVSDNKIIEKASRYITRIEESFLKAKEDKKIFREMIAYELANHEACITCSAADALDSLGLKYDDLSAEQKAIVGEELNKSIASYY